jgi:uncharacterized protein
MMKQLIWHHRLILFLVTATLTPWIAACGRQDTPPTLSESVSDGLPALVPTAVVELVTVSTPGATPSPFPSLTATHTATPSQTPLPTVTPLPTPTPTHPLMIGAMRSHSYPGSQLLFEQTLTPGDNYDRYIVSYLSEGYKIYALLTIPQGQTPVSGWPIIIFNHGYIPPADYRTTERYVAYVDGFARNGYIVFRSDYRGHGDSEGVATGGYSSPAYTIDVLNGLASVAALPAADSGRVGMWGHSMGGHITLRAMVVSDAIKAGVIWAGVVGPYPDLFVRNNMPAAGGPTTPIPPGGRGWWRQSLIETYGSVEENPLFWDSISANAFLPDLSGPIQLHHGTDDSSVPLAASQLLQAQMEAVNMPFELYIYEGDNHNLSRYFNTAMQRSLAFFDLYVKGQ